MSMLYSVNNNAFCFLDSCMKFYHKRPTTLWQVLTSEIFSFSPFLQLAPALCLCYISLKRCPEAAKGNLLLMLETIRARGHPQP